MNQEKIGKFIAENRKKKKITQAYLAEKLGVTDRALTIHVCEIKTIRFD